MSSTTKVIYGDRYTQFDRMTRDRKADHAAALATSDPLTHLHKLGYDVSTARVAPVQSVRAS